MRQAGEPSVEEILESIKKVIARDNRAGAAEQRRAREAEGVAEDASDNDHGNEASHPEDEVLELAESAEFIETEAHDEPEVQSPLITIGTQRSMRESLAALAMLSEPGAPPQIVRSGETSLEGLTRDLLRPMLAEWLEKQLPGMVERLVATEISRIVGKRG
ncbi:MAG: DUF2497 domain-containing protein [Novosphingobium sp.]|nr:DUF2497 domain-containing protein [Novosphingobium sp.]